MARNKKYEKNLQKIQSMVDGTFERHKIQVSMNGKDIHANRKVGERYFDHDGKEWEYRGDNYRISVSKLPSVGLFSKKCKDCKKPCTKKFDVDTYNRLDRCYHCQMKFELDLQFIRIGENGNKWQFWVKLQELRRWDSIDKEVKQLVFDNHEQNKKNPFDMSVANAIANDNVSMEIKKNL